MIFDFCIYVWVWTHLSVLRRMEILDENGLDSILDGHP